MASSGSLRIVPFQGSNPESLLPPPTMTPGAATRRETEYVDDDPLEFIERVLNEEEDLEKRSPDPLALQAMENSFLQALSHDKGSVEPSRRIETNGANRLAYSYSLTDFVTDVPNLSDFAAILRAGMEEASKFLPCRTALCSYIEMEDDDSPRAATAAAKSVQTYRSVNSRQREVGEMLGLFERVFIHAEDSSSVGIRPMESSRAPELRCKKVVIDLDGLVMRCARAVVVDDHSSAYEVLKEIREHSLATGDGPQRCAHYFANSLEARLAGTRTADLGLWFQLPAEEDAIKASKVLVSACPFRTIDFLFAEHHILGLAEKAQTLHIVDFGIAYCFRWFKIIDYLAARPGGSPRVRITGIEYPRLGACPAESVERGRLCLTKYCERFNISFEYTGIIAQKWEMIRAEDLKIRENEVIVVNCTLRFEKLLDEVVGMKSPRGAVLDLIRSINPSIFIHSIVNASLNVAAFHVRLREALFHFSTFYDMLDCVLPRESKEREMIEREYLGPSIMNVVACEGLERIERVETYKQWQVRTTRAGFRQLPVGRELMRTWNSLVKSRYHKEYLVYQDGNWLLQGWKGRTLYATCCWVPD